MINVENSDKEIKIQCVLSGTHVEATMLFFEFLSELFTDIMDLVYGNGGSVNKIMGDGILATFGCPTTTGDDAFQCVKTALQIREYLNTFNDVRPDYLDNNIKCGIGIVSGKVFAGNIGSVRRMEYTVLGDAVNTASRLETLTKEVQHDILIDENTYHKIKDRINFSKILIDHVKGKKDAIEIFKLFSLKDY